MSSLVSPPRHERVTDLGSIVPLMYISTDGNRDVMKVFDHSLPEAC
ncbi:hypothetical protein CU044_5796 [Streptomyces sp. L-9-10]|nr:hypothetical protein CU044_5796 [Streptomyces sp. L-9-10]